MNESLFYIKSSDMILETKEKFYSNLHHGNFFLDSNKILVVVPFHQVKIFHDSSLNNTFPFFNESILCEYLSVQIPTEHSGNY